MKTALTLFSGGGIADIGLKNAGLDIVGAVERDEKIAEVYALNHGNHIINAPVADVDYKPFVGVDLLHASPPCQSFSMARSKSLPEHPDKDAGLDILRVIEIIRPRWVTLENVPQYRKSFVCQQIRSRLWEWGYWISERVIDCADYGVPQHRKRLIMVASLDGLYSFPEKEIYRNGWYQAIADLIPDCPVTELANWQKFKMNDCPDGVFYNYRLFPHIGCREFKTYDRGFPCPTIRALGHDRHWRQFDIVKTGDVRQFTPRCAARVMTVNDNFILPSPNWLAWRILGNGFPSLAMQKISQNLIGGC